MPDELTENQPKPTRKYTRRQPAQAPQQTIAPNPQVIALEAGIVPLVNQRLDANTKVRAAAHRANLANQELQAAQSELSEIEQEINYRMQLIAQLRNGGMPIPQALGQTQFAGYPPTVPMSPPYNPVAPYPVMPGPVGSFPARNDGLYPDATDRLESAEDVRQLERGRR